MRGVKEESERFESGVLGEGEYERKGELMEEMDEKGKVDERVGGERELRWERKDEMEGICVSWLDSVVLRGADSGERKRENERSEGGRAGEGGGREI